MLGFALKIRARLLVVCFMLLVTTIVLSAVNDGTWTFTAGSLNTPRGDHTAVILPSGKILVAGGYNTRADNATNKYLNSYELYDPNTDSFTQSTTKLMKARRAFHTATNIPTSGKTLIIGGANNGNAALASIEFYDQATGTWALGNPMKVARRNHGAALLAPPPMGSSLVLVAGGLGADGKATKSAEILDLKTGVWTSVDMLHARAYHTLTRIFGYVLNANGVPVLQVVGVLAAGGRDENNNPTNSAEVLVKNEAGAWGVWQETKHLTSPPNATAPGMNTARVGHLAFLADCTDTEGNPCPNFPKIMVAGGVDAFGIYLTSAEILDPATGMWTYDAVDMKKVASGAAMTGIWVDTTAGTGITLAGGQDSDGILKRTQIFDPAFVNDDGTMGRWSVVAPMNDKRIGHTFTPLIYAQKAVAIGGYNASLVSLKTAEVYQNIK
jgi:hypothetical protein